MLVGGDGGQRSDSVMLRCDKDGPLASTRVPATQCSCEIMFKTVVCHSPAHGQGKGAGLGKGRHPPRIDLG